jgi:GTP-sensing pleiotropic transcriptional regulator CodY
MNKDRAIDFSIILGLNIICIAIIIFAIWGCCSLFSFENVIIFAVAIVAWDNIKQTMLIRRQRNELAKTLVLTEKLATFVGDMLIRETRNNDIEKELRRLFNENNRKN